MKNNIYFEEQLENLLKTGIYKITCLNNKKIYIGSACSLNHSSKKTGFYRRWMDHLKALKNNKHHNHYLQNCFNKYGSNCLKFEIIEYCSKEEAVSKENYWIKHFNSNNSKYGFNIIKNNLSNYGKFTKEHKEKISKSLTGRVRKLEDVKKWSKSVIQYDINNNIINTFYSMSEASRKTGISRQDIGQACIGKKIKTAGGYIWKKVEDIV